MDSHSNARVEPLEPRRLLAASYGAPVKVLEAALPNGRLELQISGTAGNDRIVVWRSQSGLSISNNKGGWQETIDDEDGGKFAQLRLTGNRGNDRLIVDPSVTINAVLNGAGGDDSLYGGSGNDSLYGGSGRDRFSGGAGDDLIVSLDIDHKERISGGEGLDNFWVDAAAGERVSDLSIEEIAYRAEHRVVTFNTPALVAGATNSAVAQRSTGAVPRDLYGQDLPDPALPSNAVQYMSFANRPLFGLGGPMANDVRQGTIADCYVLAPLSSFAAVDPMLIRQTIVELGDGTFGVRFFRPNGEEVHYRIDSDLPTRDWTTGTDGVMVFNQNDPRPAHAGLGADNSLWVALIEKAYAFFRRGEGAYASLNYGWMSDMNSALGLGSTTLYPSSERSVADVLRQVEMLLADGRSVTMGTVAAPASDAVVGSHAYAVVDVTMNGAGDPTGLLLRNPWGEDQVGAARDGVSDGYLNVSAAEVSNALLGFCVA